MDPANAYGQVVHVALSSRRVHAESFPRTICFYSPPAFPRNRSPLPRPGRRSTGPLRRHPYEKGQCRQPNRHGGQKPQGRRHPKGGVQAFPAPPNRKPLSAPMPSGSGKAGTLTISPTNTGWPVTSTGSTTSASWKRSAPANRRKSDLDPIQPDIQQNRGNADFHPRPDLGDPASGL